MASANYGTPSTASSSECDDKAKTETIGLKLSAIITTSEA